MINKKKIFIITIAAILTILIGIAIYLYYEYKKEKKEDAEALTLKDNLTIEYGADVKVSDFIQNLNGELIDDYYVDTSILGNNVVKFEYKSIRNKKKKREFSIDIVDTTPPVILGTSTITVKNGYSKDLTKIFLSADNCDQSPTRTIIGNYDLQVAGEYDLILKVTDASNNETDKNFTLKVVDNYTSSTTTTKTNIQFEDAIKSYKTNNTQLGIDVSQWQGNIDWQKVKNAGTEFTIIRVGYQKGFDGENVIDKYFESNIKGAIDNGIKVGVYFNSYAKTNDEAQAQANLVIDTIKDYNIDLPISFDWENWTDFMDYSFSLYNINNIAKTFCGTIQDAGYTSSLYSSKYYLANIWYTNKFENIWLAHYTAKTDYKGTYQMWQRAETGLIDGINGNVDIDILYN